MHHRLSGLSTYGLNGHRQGDQHPAYAPDGAWHPLLEIILGKVTSETKTDSTVVQYNSTVVLVFTSSV